MGTGNEAEMRSIPRILNLILTLNVLIGFKSPFKYRKEISCCFLMFAKNCL